MEGEARGGSWMRGEKGLQGWRRRGGERRLGRRMEAKLGMRVGGRGKEEGGWGGRGTGLSGRNAETEWEFSAEGGSGYSVMPLELTATHTISTSINEPTGSQSERGGEETPHWCYE